MTDQPVAGSFDRPTDETAVFGEASRAKLAFAYPESPIRLTHRLASHPLLETESLARLAESLGEASVEYNKGDLPIGIAPEDVPENGLSIGDTIRRIETANSWAVLKNIEQDEAYRGLLMDLLGEIEAITRPKTGRMLRPQGFIFISSPGSMTPYHFDPEHNILLQVRGTKTMTVFPAGDTRFAPSQAHESYHMGGHRNLVWSDDFLAHGTQVPLAPGEAIFVPVMAPHFVRNGPSPSLSLSITWRSDWSFAEAEAHATNALLRKWGLNPAPTRRYPSRNRAKAYAWKVLRRMRLVE